MNKDLLCGPDVDRSRARNMIWQRVLDNMDDRLQMKTTYYCRTSVVYGRPYLKEEWLERVRSNPIRTEVQPNGRIRCWGLIPELWAYLSVVLEPDGQTVHNAFLDRGFKP